MTTYRTWTFRPLDPAHLHAINGEHEARNAAPTPAQSIPVRVWETDSAWQVEADIPGVDPAGVSIEFFQEKLTISYDRPGPAELMATYDNRGYGLHQRVIRVTDSVRPEEISATAKNGVLLMTLPKSAAAQPRKIVVGNG